MKAYLSVSADCRDLRHSWVRDSDEVLSTRLGDVRKFRRSLSCSRCGASRIDDFEVGRSFVKKERTRYTYPTGYRVPGGVSVEAVRLALFTEKESTDE